jgi:hypothetical protein
VREELTQERLKQLLHYDPSTGVFTWKKRRGRCSAGAVAGSTNIDGHIKISVDKRYYLAHRLAWLHTYGRFPDRDIDHINRNPGDNRIENLRLATKGENQQNRSVSKNNKSGYSGVHWEESAKKWVASIYLNNKVISLGRFKSKEDAVSARQEAKKKYHQFSQVD